MMILVGIANLLQAQCTLSGTIIDKQDRSPIIGAIINIPDLKKGAVTDAEGHYKIENLPYGKFLSEIKTLGYNSLSMEVNPCIQPIVNFELSTTVIEAKEVVVTGASKATELLKMPGAVTTIDRMALFKTTSTNLIDALTSKPGIAQITTGAGISKPVIRGLGYNRILTLNDGIRQEGQQWGDEHGIEIDEFSANKIEVLKGPASLMYGSDAMAGVINILSAPAPTLGTIGGSITTNYQSNNNLAAISFMQNGNIENVSWMLRASMKNAGNYSNRYDGKVFNSGYKELDFNGNIGINKKWGYSHLIFSTFHQNVGVIEGERDSITGKFVKQLAITDTTFGYALVPNQELKSRLLQVPQQSITHSKLALDNVFIIGKSRLAILLATQQNSREEFGDITMPTTSGLHLSLVTSTYDIKYFLPEKNNWQVTFGTSGMQQQNNNLGTEYLIPAYGQFDAGAFAYVKKEVNEKLNFAGGIRYDTRQYHSESLTVNGINRFSALNKTFGNYSGSIGGTYRLKKQWVVKANIARGYRAPQSAELSSNGLHEGTFRYELGNPNLLPETSFQSDFGIIFNSDHVSIDAAFFSNQIQHFIFLQKLSSVFGGDSISDISEPTPTYQFVQGNAILNGAELSIDMHPHPFDWLHFENTFSYVQGINKNQTQESRYLPMIPATRITSELQADLKKLNNHWVNFYGLINAQIYLKQNHVLLADATETPTSGYNLFNAALGSDYKNKKGELLFSAIVSVNNIFDIAYQSHLSRLKYAPENYATGRAGVFNMGRNINVKLMVPLNYKL